VPGFPIPPLCGWRRETFAFRGSAHPILDKIKTGLANPGRAQAPLSAKENRAGWPGFFCVELDAVTSQRGATRAEIAFVLPRRESTDRKIYPASETDQSQRASDMPCIQRFHV